jgi:hypothetical protein
MNAPERPGINPKWLKSWKTTAKRNAEWIKAQDAESISEFKFYVAHGQSKQIAALKAKPVKELKDLLEPVTPPRKGWESFVDLKLSHYGSMRLAEWEIAGIDRQRWDPDLVATAFSAVYLQQMIDLYIHLLFPIRHPGRVLQRMSFSQFSFTALGLVIGRHEEALRLARLQLAAFRKQYYNLILARPISAFIARILADYLGEPPVGVRGDPPHLLKGEIPADPVMQGLFNEWRAPDPEVLLPHCIAACDIHTHQAITGANSYRLEFGNGNWTRIPIAVLLVFKLRILLGLGNPQIDHPLMNSALGKLPSETDYKPDELVESVRARMMQDGYNEQEIWDGYFG